MGKDINKHIISFSGGKDSTAMLLMMIEKNIPIDKIIFCDTGMEFPQMYNHIEKVEKYIQRPIITLKAKHSFEYWLAEHIKTKGKNKGKIGYGWSDFRNRWCTTLLKINVMRPYCKGNIEYHGIAYDERQRCKTIKNRNIKYPLVDWKITEKHALRYCYNKGFDWGGLYDKFVRVSCWCCPLQRIGELRILYYNFPELWQELKRLDKLSYRKFRNDYSVEELEQKFKYERKIKVNY